MAEIGWHPRRQGRNCSFPEIPGETVRNLSLLRDTPQAGLRKRGGGIPGLGDNESDELLKAVWNSGNLIQWNPESKLEVSLGWGSGQFRSPFSCSPESFFDVVRRYEFSPRILRRLRYHETFFEHAFSGGGDSNLTPTHLEIAASTFEHDGFLCLLRSEIATSHTKCIIFLKTRDQLKSSSLQEPSVISHLEAHEDLLQRYPLLVFNVILLLLQRRAHDFVQWRIQLYDIEARIGVSSHARGLRQNHYSEVDYNFSRLNADLTGTARRIADNGLSVSTMLQHAKAYQRVTDIYERLKHRNNAERDIPEPIYNEQHEEIQSTITRAELYLEYNTMARNVVQSLTAALYNRINKSDTRSMKTIAVVTLFFLPATFVSAIFSTGVFNFQAGEDQSHERVVSRYGWVYLLVMLLLTTLTLATWSIWYFWGERWLDTLRTSDALAKDRLGEAPLSGPSVEAKETARRRIRWTSRSKDQGIPYCRFSSQIRNFCDIRLH